MATLTISLPEQFIKRIDSEAKSQGATRSEFFRGILRNHFSASAVIPFRKFKKIPLDQMRAEMEKTGKYNKKFIDSVIRGFADSSLYAD